MKIGLYKVSRERRTVNGDPQQESGTKGQFYRHTHNDNDTSTQPTQDKQD
jgi:hypothetical protein